MYTIVIDGNYFFRRSQSIAGLTFTDNPKSDREELLKLLCDAFGSLIKRHTKHIDNVVFTRDYSSWRKTVDVIKPLESNKATDDSDYKDNRIADAAIDWGKTYAVFDDFTEMLKNSFNVPIIKTRNAEGDDILYVASKLLNSIGKSVMLWTSDGDAVQLVSDKTVLYRSTRSDIEKVYLNESTFAMINDKSDFAIFNNAPTALDSMISIATRGVHSVNPAYVLLDKLVKGDGKDNVSPLFFWKTAKTTARSKSAHIDKSLIALGKSAATITFDDLYNNQFITDFIVLLLKHAKQERDVEHTIKVFKSNRQLLFLNSREIPIDIIKAIETEIKTILPQYKPDLTKLKSSEMFSKFNITTESIFKQFGL
jgi:hypothetical protein